MSLDFNFLKSPGPYGQTNNEEEKAKKIFGASAYGIMFVSKHRQASLL